MRAADEAATVTWSCDMCPVDESRVRFSSPASHCHVSYPRVLHSRSASGPIYSVETPVQSYTYVELRLSEHCLELPHASAVNNTRRRQSVPAGPGARLAPAYVYEAGIHAGLVVTTQEARVISPLCSVLTASVHGAAGQPQSGGSEKDGVVKTATIPGGYTVYVYSRTVAGRVVRTAAIRVDDDDTTTVHATLVALHSVRVSWPDIRGFVSRDYLSAINNLSPRAWDSKRLQKKGAMYSPKVDGERAYVLIYQGSAHLFSKGKGLYHIGWRVLKVPQTSRGPIVVDVENTISHGCFLIDMLTDEYGTLSPRTRDYAWSVSRAMELRGKFGIDFVRFKPHYPTLREAEDSCAMSLYPTDGVIALWQGSTTARKMKQERSIELAVGQSGRLLTFDGDVVIESAPLPSGAQLGDVLEVRFRLARDGKSILSAPLFKRTDKSNPNTTSAVCSVLESFSMVSRSDETRRRNVTVWCDSLKSRLVKEAVGRCGNRKVIMDIGTGTGQSLDALTSDRGVSYILVEPDRDRCEKVKRRAGVGRVWTEPKDILSNIRHLKSGSQTYMVLCCALSDIVSDEELMSSIHTEIGAVIATFSAHFVVADLYELSTYWSLPVVGCFYPYDSVDVGRSLIDSLGVKMKRLSESRCSVKWGGDDEYHEPCTTLLEYQAFSSVSKATELLQAPGAELDRDVFEMCNKVYVIY